MSKSTESQTTTSTPPLVQLVDEKLPHQPTSLELPTVNEKSTRAGTTATLEELKMLLEYDLNKDGKLDPDEVAKLKADYAAKSGKHHAILEKYDANHDGNLDESELDEIHQDIKTTDSNLRYAGYARYLANLARYSAYTSDIGESFRPIAHPRLVTAAYGVSWAYVIGDVAYEGYKARHLHGYSRSEVGQHMTKRAVFQSVASMALPAFIIHSQVKLATRVFKKWGRFQKWGPTVAGLCVVPALPFVLDHPVEKVVDWTFAKFWPGPADIHEKHE